MPNWGTIIRRCAFGLGLVIGLLTGLAGTAWAHYFETATGSASCSVTGPTYSVTITGTNLEPYGEVFVYLNLTPDSGPAQTISGSAEVYPSDAAGDFTATITGPMPGGNFTLSGDALLFVGGTQESYMAVTFDTQAISCPASLPPCATPSQIASNFNGTTIQAGNYIWFNSNFTASGIPSSGATIYFTNSTIQARVNGTPIVLAVPNAQITFSPSAACATTTFDSATNTWMTTVPIAGSDEIFLDGLAFPVSTVLPGGSVQDVVWLGNFSASTSGINGQWKWSAAVYSKFSSDYNSLSVKPTHTNACAFNNSDHAGTPEAFRTYVIGGARGGGGSNFTGSWSGTLSFSPCPQ